MYIGERESAFTEDLFYGSRGMLTGRASQGGTQPVRAHFSAPGSLSELTNALRAKTLELQAISDHVDFGIFKGSIGENGVITFINPCALSILGYTQEQFQTEFSARITDFVLPEDRPFAREKLRALEKTNEPIELVCRARRRDGGIVRLKGYGAAITEPDGQRSGIYTMRDITEEEHNKALLLQRNEELMLSKKRYEIAMLNSDIMLFDYIVATGQIVLEKMSMERFGLPRIIENAAHTDFWNVTIHKNSLCAFRTGLQRIDAGDPCVKFTALLTDRNGRETLNELVFNNVFDEAGKPVRAICVMTDITERNMLQSERKYRQSMASDRVMTYESNVTQDTLISMDEEWAALLGVPHFQSFTELRNHLLHNVVHPDCAAQFRDFASPDRIRDTFDRGHTQVSIQYRRRDATGKYSWVQNTMNVIRDDLTGDLKIRCYIKIIDDLKEKELRVQEEQRFYEMMLSKSALVYEVNLTKDLAVRGHENWNQLYGILPAECYSEMIASFAEKAIHPDDAGAFASLFARDNALAAFYEGQNELYCEYRRPDGNGSLPWVSCTMHMFEENDTNEIRGFSYVQNINEEKLKRLELIYKSEHDPMTGLYNKAVTESAVSEFLLTDAGKTSTHAFFILDIDHFKSINDHFGHVFGDAVLSEVARKLRSLFRDDDILGRIGGDEFAVLMKNISGERAAILKAREICDSLRESYTQNGRVHSVTASVGIAYYLSHGRNYQELYEHSDRALYVSKERGRDRFTVYKNNMGSQTSITPDVDNSGLVESKSFAENISEYVFRILYESADKPSAINAVLTLIGKHYNMSRSYIFEDSGDGLYTTNTFEWCNEGVESQIENLQQVPYSILGNYRENFNEQGIYYMPDISEASKFTQAVLEPQSVKSMLQFAIIKNGGFAGFIGYDECKYLRVMSRAEVTNLKNIANILGVFIMEMRALAANEATRDVALSIVNGLDSYAYVIDADTYRLLFINDKTRAIAPEVRIGNDCYRAFWGIDQPCESCPMRELTENHSKHCSKEMFNPNFGVHVRASASWIDWTDGRKACLVDSVDITAYKKPQA